MKPYLIIEWNDTETDAVGWTCLYNTVRGYADGGIRMHTNVSKEEVVRLATTMAWKHEACKPGSSGGCKAGIRYDYKATDAEEVLERFIVAMMPYIDVGVALAGDLGVPFATTRKIYKKYGREIPLTKTMKTDTKIIENMRAYNVMLDEKIQGFALNDCITGFGVAWALDEAWKSKHGDKKGRVFIQGFGCVGASAAQKLVELGYTIVGVSDALGLVEYKDGLDIAELKKNKNNYGEMDRSKFDPKYTTQPNSEWLSVDCDILIPAALEDVLNKDNANLVKASLIVEGANIATTPEADTILQGKGVDIVVDFVANLGAVRGYHSVIFGNLEHSGQAVLDDIESVCRSNTKRLFEYSIKENVFQREAAYKIFAPTFQDPLEI